MKIASLCQVLFLVIYPILSFLSTEVEARPEFAVRHNINRCTSCHFSPVGGGLRTTYGKLYGAHGFKISPYASQDYVSAEMRMAYYRPQNEDIERSGLFVMAGILGGSIAITPEEEKTEVRAVLSHTVYGGTAWDSYLRIRRYSDTETGWGPQYIVLGRFHAPFGLINDEHRTYTKLQTATDYNLSLETGVMASGQPFDQLHYDVAIVNGVADNGALKQGNADVWGGVGNVRFTSSSRWFPALWGVSYKAHDRLEGQRDPWAAAIYGILSLERMTKSFIRADIHYEYTRAKHFNENFFSAAGFPVNDTYKQDIKNSESEGLFAQMNYYLSEKFVLQAKWDRVLLNKNFPADAFERYGVGFRHYFAANTLVILRHEWTSIGRPEDKATPVHRADDAMWVYFQVGI